MKITDKDFKNTAWKVFKWMPIEEGPPRHEIDVLLCDEAGKIWVGCRFMWTVNIKGKDIESESYTGKYTERVTHWMPLPDQPARG